MRDLKRNQTSFWYSLYSSKEPVLKNGFKTGQYKSGYTEPVKAMACISPATGDSAVEMFGTDIQYDRVISSVQSLPIDEFSRLWVEADPSTGAEYDYKVKRVAKGLNQNLWAIEKVVRNGYETNQV